MLSKTYEFKLPLRHLLAVAETLYHVREITPILRR
jgi:hypothetical protein